MKTKWAAPLLALSLAVIATIGAFWFGRSFQLGVVVLIFSASVVTWLLVRHHKAQLVRDLADADRETQDAALAELDADDRKEMLRRLGRDA